MTTNFNKRTKKTIWSELKNDCFGLASSLILYYLIIKPIVKIFTEKVVFELFSFMNEVYTITDFINKIKIMLFTTILALLIFKTYENWRINRFKKHVKNKFLMGLVVFIIALIIVLAFFHYIMKNPITMWFIKTSVGKIDIILYIIFMAFVYSESWEYQETKDDDTDKGVSNHEETTDKK